VNKEMIAGFRAPSLVLCVSEISFGMVFAEDV